MRSLRIVSMKLRPEYWSDIEAGVKRFEVRDTCITPCDGIVFTDPKTGRKLGAARIISETTLTDWTPELVAQIAGISVKDATELFGGHIGKTRKVNTIMGVIEKECSDPLYAYRIEPCDTDRLFDDTKEEQ